MSCVVWLSKGNELFIINISIVSRVEYSKF